MKNFKSLYGFGGRRLKIRDVCMDFEPCFKVHDLVSVHPNRIILGQIINRPFAAKPSRDLLFIKLWAATLRMPEMEKACRKRQNGKV